MITFNELRITKDGKHLIIDVSVRKQSYYDDVYIKSVYIDTQDTYKDGGPSSSVIYNIDTVGNVKNFRLELDATDLTVSLSDNLFFVYVQATGIPSADTPCGMDEEYTLGVTFNPCSLYNAFMSYIRQVNNTCDTPKHFIDLFLQFKALEISINTEHYMQAVEYYNAFIKDIQVQDSTKTCGCHG